VSLLHEKDTRLKPDIPVLQPPPTRSKGVAVGCAVLLRLLLLLVAVVTAVTLVGGVARTGNGFDPKASNISGVNIDRE